MTDETQPEGTVNLGAEPTPEPSPSTSSTTAGPLPADSHDHPAVEVPEPSPPTTTSWIVVHSNPHGAHFATLVSADNAEDAEAAVNEAHEDNTIEDVLPNHGEATHGYGGSVLPVVDIDAEP